MTISAAVSAAPAPFAALAASGQTLPSGWTVERLAHADFERLGQDLAITDAHGETLLVKGQFASDAHADLALDGGMAFRAAWVGRLVMGSGQVAQAAPAGAAASIGTVKTLAGEVTVARLDGSRAVLKVGDEVRQGDVLETGKSASVGIVFLDGSNFSLGGNGKMILDEMVYDPASQSGSANVGVMSGAFAFISGQIAKTSPDAMKVTTPSATIGFRGTSGSGEVGGDGQTSIVLIRDPDGTIGEIVLVTPAGVFSLSSVLQAATVSINPLAPVVIQTMTPAQFAQQYGAVASQLPAASGNSQFIQGATTPPAGRRPKVRAKARARDNSRTRAKASSSRGRAKGSSNSSRSRWLR